MTVAELQKVGRAYERAAARAEQLRQERHVAVLQALAEGMSQAQIARATGLTRGRINQIVRSADTSTKHPNPERNP